MIGLLLYLNSRMKRKAMAEPFSEPIKGTLNIASDCCGAHEVCEFDEADFDEETIIYFNDEELDELRNVRESDLTAEQIDDLREVLYTLQPQEINKWLTSLARRHIHLPSYLQQEARQLIAES
jgi:hypothetical protein